MSKGKPEMPHSSVLTRFFWPFDSKGYFKVLSLLLLLLPYYLLIERSYARLVYVKKGAFNTYVDRKG